ncbi:MAG: cyanophycinase [Burkholderiales bacterium]|nr:cyanophycinase [Nitrosomonadaceae bacterium]
MLLTRQVAVLPARWIALCRRLPRCGRLCALAGWATATLASTIALTATAAASAATPAATPAAKAARGSVVAIGGALQDNNVEVWSRLVALAGGKSGRWLVIPTASGDPTKSGEAAIALLKRQGATAEMIPLSTKLGSAADLAALVKDPAWLKKLGTARGVYFTGGDQARITDALLTSDGQATPMLDAIRALLQRGGVVAGSSAGAAIMSSTMFRDPRDMLSMMIDGAAANTDIGSGLGFVANGVFVDQHFVKRGRIGRMLAVMAQERIGVGVGVEENSAAIFRGDDIEVIGARGVVVADLRSATAMARPLRVKGAHVYWLESGDKMNLQTGEVTPSPAKAKAKKLDHTAKDFQPYFRRVRFMPDMLGDGVFVNAMTSLVDSPATELRAIAFAPGLENRTGFEFRLHKTSGTLGYFESAGGGERYSVVKLALDVEPIRMASPLYSGWGADVGARDGAASKAGENAGSPRLPENPK